MPDQEGNKKGPGFDGPMEAYKEGREEDIEPGTMGADPDPEDAAAGSGSGTYQSGGFTGSSDAGDADGDDDSANEADVLGSKTGAEDPASR